MKRVDVESGENVVKGTIGTFGTDRQIKEPDLRSDSTAVDSREMPSVFMRC